MRKLAAIGIFVSVLAAAGTPSAAAGPVELERLTTSELHARLAAGCPVALIYNGGIDETGPHVALGKHNLRALAYGKAVAAALGDAILSPVIPYAPNARPVPELPGEIALRPETHLAINEDVARSLIDGGFRRVAILADHGLGQQELSELALRLDREYRLRGIRIFFISDSYKRARAEIEAEIKATGQIAGGHGGLWDTSETMAVDATAVRPEKFAFGTSAEDGNGPTNAAGFSGDPRNANADLGRRFGETRVRLAVDEIRRNLISAGTCKN